MYLRANFVYKHALSLPWSKSELDHLELVLRRVIEQNLHYRSYPCQGHRASCTISLVLTKDVERKFYIGLVLPKDMERNTYLSLVLPKDTKRIDESIPCKSQQAT